VSAGHVAAPVSPTSSGPAPNLRKHLDIDGLMKLLALLGVLYAAFDKVAAFGVARKDIATIAQLAEKQAQMEQEQKEQRLRREYETAERAKTDAALVAALGELKTTVVELNKVVTQIRIDARRR
jgi:hypothetical protein